jgi:NAD(P)-dependent dehydrogenase (short-subunit alcohol dehydrogenase family)
MTPCCAPRTLPSSSEPGRLAGKVVACTGGGSGIGRAVVEAFVAEGARVAILELDREKCGHLAGLGDAVAPVYGDARSAAANEELAVTALERWGTLDVAVTFVGVFDFYTRLLDIDAGDFDAAFDEVFDLNVRSPLLTARAALPGLRASKGSLILTLSSSSFYPGRGGALYVGSKFALRGVVVQLAHEEAPDVRVNGVAPGGTVATDLRGPRSLGMDDRRLADRPGRDQELRARNPLGVALTGSDHAGAYVFLASDESLGLTGEILRSDGGLGAR